MFIKLPLSSQIPTFCSVCCVTSSYADNWASAPWQAPEPLEAVQHLRSLLCTIENDTGDQNVPRKVCSVVGGILDNIEEKIKTHCKYKHLIHVEHQVDASSGRDLVRIWKCVEVQHYTDFGYDPHSCPEGYTTIGRRLMLSTYGSKRYGKPLPHGR